MSMNTPCKLAGAGALAMLAAAAAQAALVSGTGAISIIAAPASVAGGALESNTVVHAFNEKQGLTLTNALTVDFAPPGYGGPGVIAAGTVVDSHLVHFDKVGGGGNQVTLSGSVTFDGIILGLIMVNSSLNATDVLLGSPTTTYLPAGTSRGFPEGNGDSFTVINGQLTFSFTSRTSGTGVDQMRIVTASVPEPGSMALAGLALAALAGARARRKTV